MQALQLILRQMSEAYHDKQQLHAILVHLPIAASILGLVLIVALVLTRGRSAGLRWACFIVLALGALSGYLAAAVGEDAEMFARDNLVSTPAADAELEAHTDMGDKVWIFLAGTAVLTALTALKVPVVRMIVLILTLLAGVTTFTWVGITGHRGGRLVYVYGAVAPPGEKAATQPPATASPKVTSPRPPTTMPAGR
jgi:uncharacterized membrane protein